MSSLIEFAKQQELPDDNYSECWKILTIKDDHSVPVITRSIIEDIRISGRNLEPFSAYSAHLISGLWLSEEKMIMQESLVIEKNS